MRRREFLGVLGGAVAAWPLAVRAQQIDHVRRIGVLLQTAADDPESLSRLAALHQGLQQLGWTDGRNVLIDVRWGAVDIERVRKYSAELIASAPDVVLATGGTIVGVLQQATSIIPIVFVNVTDPVGVGLVDSLARPGGHTTGFAQFEYSISTKWLELLKQIAPGVLRVAIIRDPSAVASGGQFGAIQGTASSFGVEVSPVDARDAGVIERAITAFAGVSHGGLIVTSSRLAAVNRDLIIRLSARHHLPAVYPYRLFVTSGGLISYGPDQVNQYRQAAGYIDRILKGEKAADLPVQTPTKLELVINLKAAKTLGVAIPSTLLARADEVIE